MDIRSGKAYPASSLSNFARHQFELDDVVCASMEGFLQGLKFKSVDMQEHVCTLSGIAAKRKGAKKNWQRTQTLHWKGVPIKRDSIKYQELLDRAYIALFTQSDDAKKALLSTNNATLTHSIGRNNPKETVLTEREFVSRLHSNRNHWKLMNFIN